MTDKQLSRLGRGELIEIVYQLKKNEEKLKAQIEWINHDLEESKTELEQSRIELEQCKTELEQAKSELGSGKMHYTKVGSIAEAALSINGVFEAAQKAADDYVALIHSNYSDIEGRCTKLLSETESKCQLLEQETDRKINAKWALFNKKVQEYLQTRNEISELLK